MCKKWLLNFSTSLNIQFQSIGHHIHTVHSINDRNFVFFLGSVQKCSSNINLNLLQTFSLPFCSPHTRPMDKSFVFLIRTKPFCSFVGNFFPTSKTIQRPFNAFQFWTFFFMNILINYVFNSIWLSLFDRVLNEKKKPYRQYQSWYVSFNLSKNSFRVVDVQCSVLRNKLRFIQPQ